jgi:2-dehydro-3-deoxygluconokinase
MGVVLFGELLMRLQTPQRERFVQASQFDVHYTGGEANAGVLLSALGTRCRVVSAVPANDLGTACIQHMRRYGLETTWVRRQGNRLGTVYLELGASQRPSRVIYDRAHSSFSQLKKEGLPWNEILQDQQWLHFTGTAPGVNAQLAEVTLEACHAAHRLGLTVSCDLNYRSALWSMESARPVLQEIVNSIDVLIANEEHARDILDVSVDVGLQTNGKFCLDRYSALTEALRKTYELSVVALTIRAGQVADQTSFSAILDDGSNQRMARRYDIQVVDRVGAGDAFSGGLIHAQLQAWEAGRSVEFATACGALKHSMPGDFCHSSEQEIMALVESGEAGRIER